MRFLVVSLAVVLALYGAGYLPAKAWDPPQGPLGALSGLTLAFCLAAGGYAAARWALGRSQKVFLTVFGVGFLARLVLFVAAFFVYWKVVGEGVISFALAFGLGYAVLGVVESIHLRGAARSRGS